MRIELDGKVASIKERRKGLIQEAQHRIKKLGARVAKLSINPDAKPTKSGLKFETPEKKSKRLFDLHHKKRRLVTLRSRLARMQADDEANVARLCFGSKKLFHAQFDLSANQYSDPDAWRRDWDKHRSDQFFVLGSKDETAGNQSCQATVAPDGSLALRLRTPNAASDGAPDAVGQFITITDVHFAYGHSEIVVALGTSQRIKAKTVSGKTIGKQVSKLTGTALSYRFVRDDKSWSVLVSVQARAVAASSNPALGVIGVDTNADHLAVAETDRFGNLTHVRRLSTPTYGKSTDQAKAVLGDAAAMIAARAKALGKPVVIEVLDFAKKKAELQKTDARYARMLSSFACNQTASSIKAACFRAGVQVIEVNPAYTSVIGAVNHAQTKGISVHQGAAFAIARRGLGLSERATVLAGLVPVRNAIHRT
jgi:IS605 OrfB family transposase